MAALTGGLCAQASDNSNLISLVPALRGLVLHVGMVPPLPGWATLFRP